MGGGQIGQYKVGGQLPMRLTNWVRKKLPIIGEKHSGREVEYVLRRLQGCNSDPLGAWQRGGGSGTKGGGWSLTSRGRLWAQALVALIPLIRMEMVAGGSA